MTGHAEEATFGGGCFWCLEAVFLELHGVQSVQSGYAGGSAENPTYEQVCNGSTGHAEVIQVRYKGARDRLDLPAKLNAKLAELTSVVAAADFAPPKQTYDVLSDITGRINLQLQRLEEVINQDVVGFEHLLRELQILAIVPRTGP